MSDVPPHVQALRDALVTDHEQQIAEARRLADAAPDEWGRKFYTDRVQRLKAMPYPWETTTTRPA